MESEEDTFDDERDLLAMKFQEYQNRRLCFSELWLVS